MLVSETVNDMKCDMPGELPMPCMPTDAAMLLVLLAPELLGICWYGAMPVELAAELIPASTSATSVNISSH